MVLNGLKKKSAFHSSAVIAAGLAMISLSAQAANTNKVRQVVGVSYGVAEPAGTFSEASQSPGDWGFEDGDAVSLIWGVEDSRFRAAMELSYVKMEAEEFTANSASQTVEASGTQAITGLYYNFYWTPSLPFRFNALIGGAVGYSLVELKDLSDSGASGTVYDDSDTTFSAKLGAGLEYAVLPNLSISALYQWVSHRDVDIEQNDERGRFSDLEYSNLSVGVNFRF